MSEYYAVQRSTDHLAHYGVKGMKWGIKKALSKSTSEKTNKALGKQFNKAKKKLAKLESKADINKQKAVVSVQKKKAIRSGIATGALAGLTAASGSGTLKLANRVIKSPTTKFNSFGNVVRMDPIHKDEIRTSLARTGGIGIAAGALLGKTAYHAGKAIAVKHRTTEKGHAKAVAKANAWKKEMQKAFKGTKYANQISSGSKTSASKSNNTKKRRNAHA